VITVSRVLSSLMHGQLGEETLPGLLCGRCSDDVHVTGVGMALMSEEDHGGVVGATDATARRMEELQYMMGEGPCIDSSTGGRPVMQPDLVRTAPTRWPGFGPAVLETGVAAIFAFPLQVGGIRLGVLDLYRDRSGPLDQAQVRDALTYADAAVVLLLHLQQQTQPGSGLHPQLVDPQDYRPEVHQATGMVSVQAAIGLTEALLLLRARAFSSERSILDIARDVIARRLRFGSKAADDE